MSALARFEHYLDEARRLLRREILARTAAGVAVVACLGTLAAVAWLASRGFPEQQVVLLRVALILAVLAVAGAVLLPPLLRLRRDDGAHELERHLPHQQGRIQTLLDILRRARSGEPVSPLTELLAADAERVAATVPLEEALPARRRRLPAGIAIASVLLLVLLGAAGPRGWDAGTRHLWFGQPLPEPVLEAARGLDVRPGNATVRRNQDLTVSAQLKGVRASEARLHVRYGDGEWETAPMRSTTDGTFDLTLYALREPAEYYVSAGGLTSERYRLGLVDLPRITALKLRYDYPSWTGLPARLQEEDGSIEAVAGTRVTIEVEADAPLEQPLLVVDENSQPLQSQGLRGSGSLTVKGDGHYRIAARFGDELVALTEDFPIIATPDEKPVVEVVRPGRDYQASAIEEVPVRLRARDDFRVDRLELRYSVNGGPWQTQRVPAGQREIDTATLLNLEELGGAAEGGPRTGPQNLVPGDLITYYAVARDHSQEAQTDLFMVQVQPFDRRYSQSQAGGGGGGGGDDDQTGIAERQREILLATFNLTRDAARGGRDAERRADNARMLAELQGTLRDQARTLVERTRARELATADPSIRQFVESLEKAAREMDPAAERLSKLELEQAIPNEQKALQHLLRAEAAFRDIQVARNNSQGGGGGGQAGRDVSEMTELELDLEKNQYETEQQLAQNGQPNNPAQDEALRRLKELARRQEQLAREQQRNAAQPEAQRWRQEQLRREAEQLRRQLEQLAQQQSGQRDDPQQRQARSGQQSGNSAAAAAAEAARQLEQALAQMRDGEQKPGQQSAREASRAINRAVERLERGRQEALGESFEQLASEADALLAEQRRTEEELGNAVRNFRARQQQRGQQGGQRQGSDLFGGLDFQSAERLAERKRELQQRLEALKGRMQSAQRAHKADAPQASERVAKAAQELDEAQITARLARSALEIERGRTMQAAARDGLITEALENLQRELRESATVASAESRQRGRDEEAGPEELLAELATLRRAVDEARERAAREGLARAGEPGQPGERNERGERGQGAPPGQQAGLGEVSQDGEGGEQAGGSQPGSQPGGEGGGTRLAGGAWGGSFGGGPDEGVWNGTGAWRGSLIRETRASSERLAELRGRLGRGRLPDQDLKALQELTARLRRANGGDPMSDEYRRMLALVDQLELAALRAGDRTEARVTRGNARTEEPARYRENVAEYYRRLGERPGDRARAPASP